MGNISPTSGKQFSIMTSTPVLCVTEADAESRYVGWKLLLRLLQDEDEDVRCVAARSSAFLTRIDSSLSTTPGE